MLSKAKSEVNREINSHLIDTYWKVGRLITDREKIEELSGRKLILELSKTLTKQLGRGFSRSNLFNMKSFYQKYSNVQTVSGHLSWSHICELLSIDDEDKRSFYEIRLAMAAAAPYHRTVMRDSPQVTKHDKRSALETRGGSVDTHLSEALCGIGSVQ